MHGFTLSQKESCNVATVMGFTLQPLRQQRVTFDTQVTSSAMRSGMVRSRCPSELPARSVAVNLSHSA